MSLNAGKEKSHPKKTSQKGHFWLVGRRISCDFALLELQRTSCNNMKVLVHPFLFSKILNHPLETTIYRWDVSGWISCWAVPQLGNRVTSWPQDGPRMARVVLLEVGPTVPWWNGNKSWMKKLEKKHSPKVGVHHKHQPLHEKIKPKNWKILFFWWCRVSPIF